MGSFMKKRIIKIDNIECGGDTLFLISGPCVIEDEHIMMRSAEELKRVSENLNIPVIFKSSFLKDNRSNSDYYSGPGLEPGLELLKRIKELFGFPLLSDVHYPDQIEQCAEVLDIIQIPAYLCMQTRLITKAAETGKVINIKHGQFLAPDNISKPVAKVEAAGNKNIMLTERGYTFGYNDLVVDPRSFYHLNLTGYPVVFDATHSIRRYGIPSADPNGGNKEYLSVLSRSAVAAGVDGLFIESHPNPGLAMCDAASQLNVSKLEEFIKPLIDIYSVTKKYT